MHKITSSALTSATWLAALSGTATVAFAGYGLKLLGHDDEAREMERDKTRLKKIMCTRMADGES